MIGNKFCRLPIVQNINFIAILITSNAYFVGETALRMDLRNVYPNQEHGPDIRGLDSAEKANGKMERIRWTRRLKDNPW
jgi:hypothetical protein